MPVGGEVPAPDDDGDEEAEASPPGPATMPSTLPCAHPATRPCASAECASPAISGPMAPVPMALVPMALVPIAPFPMVPVPMALDYDCPGSCGVDSYGDGHGLKMCRCHAKGGGSALEHCQEWDRRSRFRKRPASRMDIRSSFLPGSVVSWWNHVGRGRIRQVGCHLGALHPAQKPVVQTALTAPARLDGVSWPPFPG